MNKKSGGSRCRDKCVNRSDSRTTQTLLANGTVKRHTALGPGNGQPDFNARKIRDTGNLFGHCHCHSVGDDLHLADSPVLPQASVIHSLLIGMHLLTYPAFLSLLWLLQDMRPAFAVASGGWWLRES